MKYSKRKLPLFLFALTILALSWGGCEDGICTRDNGDMVTEVIAIPEFEGIDMQISGDVFLTQGSPQKVEVYGASNLIDKLKRDVSNGVWDIEFRGCASRVKDFEVRITVPNLNYVKLSGSGSIRTENRFDVSDLDLRVSGSGELILDADADNVDMDLSGSGRVSLDMTAADLKSTISGSGRLEIIGESPTHDLQISGSGQVIGFDFLTLESIARISGSGKAEVAVADRLEARISGSGDVYYKGSPQLDVNISGSGRVIDAN